MAAFTKFTPAPEQTGVARTTLVGFTVLVDAYGVQMGTLTVAVGGQQVISSGGFVNGYTGNIFAGSGKYVVGIHPKGPSYLPVASTINVLISVRDAYGTLDSYGYQFYTAGYVPPPPPPPEPPTGRACLTGKPFFLSNNAGLQAALDEGTGTEAELQWNEAAPYEEDDFVAYNVYEATKRVDVFSDPPKFLVVDQKATVGGLPPGNTHYFGLRATEIAPAVSSLLGLRQVGQNMFAYPETALDGYLLDDAVVVPVLSVDGFPEYGIVEIDTELVRYLELRQFPPALVTDATGRGYLGTTAEAHISGSVVLLWRGNEDGNTIIAEATPSFQKPNYAITWVLGDGYGPDGYRDGYDGYDASGRDGYFFPKQIKRDDLTTDGSNNDALSDFPRMDYCGTYRRRPPSDFWKGQCIGSYFGGVQLRDGHLVRANDVQDQMLQREELLLETTGEPFVLLRRLWTGVRCSCFMLRREHPDARCPICFSVGFVTGYEQFFNPRRPDGRILVRVDPATDDLKIGDNGLTPDYKPSSWTMAFPAVKDRDILVRFNQNNTEEMRYEVLDVTRVRAFFGQAGVQKFNMQRFHRTDIVYQYAVTRDFSPYAVTLVTGVAAGPGIQSHAHTVHVPQGLNLALFNGTTTVNTGSEKHSHIVRSGKVLVVLGHTHSL